MKRPIVTYGVTVMVFGFFWATVAFLDAKQRVPEWVHFGSPVFFYALYVLLFIVGLNLYSHAPKGWRWALRIVVPAIITVVCIMLFAPLLIWLYVAQGGKV